MWAVLPVNLTILVTLVFRMIFGKRVGISLRLGKGVDVSADDLLVAAFVDE